MDATDCFRGIQALSVYHVIFLSGKSGFSLTQFNWKIDKKPESVALPMGRVGLVRLTLCIFLTLFTN